MRLDTVVKQELARFPVPFEIIKTKDHYYLGIDGKKTFIIANNGTRTNSHMAAGTAARIRKLAEQIKSTGVKDGGTS